MIKRPSNNWYENVLAARERCLQGLLNPKRKYKITKKDIKRLDRRLFDRVISIGKRRF